MQWSAVVIVLSLGILSQQQIRGLSSRNLEDFEIPESQTQQIPVPDKNISTRSKYSTSEDATDPLTVYLYLTTGYEILAETNCLKCIMPHLKRSNYQGACACLPCSIRIRDSFELPRALIMYLQNLYCPPDKERISDDKFTRNQELNRYIKFVENYMKDIENDKDKEVTKGNGKSKGKKTGKTGVKEKNKEKGKASGKGKTDEYKDDDPVDAEDDDEKEMYDEDIDMKNAEDGDSVEPEDSSSDRVKGKNKKTEASKPSKVKSKSRGGPAKSRNRGSKFEDVKNYKIEIKMEKDDERPDNSDEDEYDDLSSSRPRLGISFRGVKDGDSVGRRTSPKKLPTDGQQKKNGRTGKGGERRSSASRKSKDCPHGDCDGGEQQSDDEGVKRNPLKKDKMKNVFRKIMSQMQDMRKLTPAAGGDDSDKGFPDGVQSSRRYGYRDPYRSGMNKRRMGLDVYQHSYARPSYQFRDRNVGNPRGWMREEKERRNLMSRGEYYNRMRSFESRMPSGGRSSAPVEDDPEIDEDYTTVKNRKTTWRKSARRQNPPPDLINEEDQSRSRSRVAENVEYSDENKRQPSENVQERVRDRPRPTDGKRGFAAALAERRTDKSKDIEDLNDEVPKSKKVKSEEEEEEDEVNENDKNDSDGTVNEGDGDGGGKSNAEEAKTKKNDQDRDEESKTEVTEPDGDEQDSSERSGGDETESKEDNRESKEDAKDDRAASRKDGQESGGRSKGNKSESRMDDKRPLTNKSESRKYDQQSGARSDADKARSKMDGERSGMKSKMDKDNSRKGDQKHGEESRENRSDRRNNQDTGISSKLDKTKNDKIKNDQKSGEGFKLNKAESRKDDPTSREESTTVKAGSRKDITGSSEELTTVKAESGEEVTGPGEELTTVKAESGEKVTGSSEELTTAKAESKEEGHDSGEESKLENATPRKGSQETTEESATEKAQAVEGFKANETKSRKDETHDGDSGRTDLTSKENLSRETNARPEDGGDNKQTTGGDLTSYFTNSGAGRYGQQTTDAAQQRIVSTSNLDGVTGAPTTPEDAATTPLPTNASKHNVLQPGETPLSEISKDSSTQKVRLKKSSRMNTALKRARALAVSGDADQIKSEAAVVEARMYDPSNTEEENPAAIAKKRKKSCKLDKRTIRKQEDTVFFIEGNKVRNSPDKPNEPEIRAESLTSGDDQITPDSFDLEEWTTIPPPTDLIRGAYEKTYKNVDDEIGVVAEESDTFVVTAAPKETTENLAFEQYDEDVQDGESDEAKPDPDPVPTAAPTGDATTEPEANPIPNANKTKSKRKLPMEAEESEKRNNSNEEGASAEASAPAEDADREDSDEQSPSSEEVTNRKHPDDTDKAGQNVKPDGNSLKKKETQQDSHFVPTLKILLQLQDEKESTNIYDFLMRLIPYLNPPRSSPPQVLSSSYYGPTENPYRRPIRPVNQNFNNYNRGNIIPYYGHPLPPWHSRRQQ